MSNAPAAPIWIASVLTDEEFLRFVTRTSKNKTSVAGHKLDEFLKVIDEIRRGPIIGQLNFGYASARTSIFRLDGRTSGHGHPCEIMALSPSHGERWILDKKCRKYAESEANKAGDTVPITKSGIRSHLISVGPLAIVLGADVENSGRPTAGWEAILGAHNLSPLDLGLRCTKFLIMGLKTLTTQAYVG